MPCPTNAELPRSVRQHLLERAQDIFREAFNGAYARYDEVTAFRVAWAAVKRQYEHVDGDWGPRRER
jgi:cation transport regulator